MAIRKIAGWIFVVLGTIIFFAGPVVAVMIITDWYKNPAPGEPGFEAMLTIILALVYSLPLLLIGGLLLRKKKGIESIKENPGNPLICQNCKRDYDRSWKVCLYCKKPLTEK